ncbi:MAG TPA: class I SAM-dependent methyltransferase [Acidimicrobiales bacterium]|jgi:SAM-dependent methyltransferase|nr:class I SAM-dependent methyltransferase [Acidimicrobiales bacterium]
MTHPAQPDLATADGHDRHVPSDSADILSAGHEGVYEWAAEHLVRNGSRFLDLGCGTGYGSNMVTRAGGSFDGIDGSPAAIGYARANYSGPDVRFFVGDLMAALPDELAPASYDVVFSSEVLEHVVDPFAFVDAMARFMRPDGACFIGTPNRLWSKANMPGGGLLATSHVMEFTPPALLALLHGAFADVSLFFRRLPEGADRSIVPSGARPPVVRGAVAFAREVAPKALVRYGQGFGRRKDGRTWSPDDISWLAADDPGVDPAACIGLAAVCRAPRS